VATFNEADPIIAGWGRRCDKRDLDDYPARHLFEVTTAKKEAHPLRVRATPVGAKDLVPEARQNAPCAIGPARRSVVRELQRGRRDLALRPGAEAQWHDSRIADIAAASRSRQVSNGMTASDICFDGTSVFTDIVHEHRGLVAQAKRAS
jgi:hypothetical protein